MQRRDATGKRGEAIFTQDIMDSCGNELPYFNPIFLGEKNEALDFLVELVEDSVVTRFFFVQVKATRLGYTKNKANPRLIIQLSKKSLDRIRNYPAPTYLVGIDEPKAISYVVAIHEGMTRGISSISTARPLNCDNLKTLRDEIRDYWENRDMNIKGTIFTN